MAQQRAPPEQPSRSLIIAITIHHGRDSCDAATAAKRPIDQAQQDRPALDLLPSTSHTIHRTTITHHPERGVYGLGTHTPRAGLHPCPKGDRQFMSTNPNPNPDRDDGFDWDRREAEIFHLDEARRGRDGAAAPDTDPDNPADKRKRAGRSHRHPSGAAGREPGQRGGPVLVDSDRRAARRPRFTLAGCATRERRPIVPTWLRSAPSSAANVGVGGRVRRARRRLPRRPRPEVRREAGRAGAARLRPDVPRLQPVAVATWKASRSGSRSCGPRSTDPEEAKMYERLSTPARPAGALARHRHRRPGRRPGRRGRVLLMLRRRPGRSTRRSPCSRRAVGVVGAPTGQAVAGHRRGADRTPRR